MTPTPQVNKNIFSTSTATRTNSGSTVVGQEIINNSVFTVHSGGSTSTTTTPTTTAGNNHVLNIQSSSAHSIFRWTPGWSGNYSLGALPKPTRSFCSNDFNFDQPKTPSMWEMILTQMGLSAANGIIPGFLSALCGGDKKKPCAENTQGSQSANANTACGELSSAVSTFKSTGKAEPLQQAINSKQTEYTSQKAVIEKMTEQPQKTLDSATATYKDVSTKLATAKTALGAAKTAFTSASAYYDSAKADLADMDPDDPSRAAQEAEVAEAKTAMETAKAAQDKAQKEYDDLNTQTNKAKVDMDAASAALKAVKDAQTQATAKNELLKNSIDEAKEALSAGSDKKD